MLIYLLNILSIFCWASVLLLKQNSLRNKKIFCSVVSFQWILLSGLRHFSIGSDTISYKDDFDGVLNTSWSTHWDNFLNTYFGTYNMKAPGYNLLVKTFQIFSTDYQLFLILIALAFTIPLGVFIYKNSKEPFVSFLIYSCLFYSFFAITGHRQTIATALVVLIGYEFIKKRKFIPFLTLSIIAFTIHKSAIVFLPFYFIAPLKISKKSMTIYILLAIILLIFNRQIYTPLATMLNYEGMIDTGITGTGNFVFMMILVGITAIWRSKRILSSDPNFNYALNALALAVIFSILTLIDQSFMRIQQYFSLFLLVCIPKIIYTFKDRERVIVHAVATITLILLLISNNPKYLFFWQ